MQYRDSVDLPSSCHSSINLRHLPLDRGRLGNSCYKFPLMVELTLSACFFFSLKIFFRCGISPFFRFRSFPASWRQVNVTPIPITITLKVCHRHLASVCPGRSIEHRGVIPTTQFAYKKGIGTCDTPLCVPNTSQSSFQFRVGRMIGLFRLASKNLLTGSTIIELSSSSTLWVLEILVQSVQTQSPSNPSQGDWMVVGVND